MKIFKFAVILAVLLANCHVFDDWGDEADVVMKFEDNNLTIMKGGLANFVLKIEPPDAYENLGVSYEISNKSVGVIYRGDRNGVLISGIGEGSCIITAKLGDVEARGVLTVTENLEFYKQENIKK
jgi:hypothetical protein